MLGAHSKQFFSQLEKAYIGVLTKILNNSSQGKNVAPSDLAEDPGARLFGHQHRSTTDYLPGFSTWLHPTTLSKAFW